MRSCSRAVCILLTITLFAVIILFNFISTLSAQNIYWNYIQNDNVSSRDSRFDLCIIYYATTFNVEHSIELQSVVDIYRDRQEVYFMLDNINISLTNKICNIPERCIYVDYNRDDKMRLLTRKTIAIFQYLYDNQYHHKCNWMIKADTDTFIDIDRYTDFMKYNFNASVPHYFGWVCSCKTDILMGQGGTYGISRGVFEAKQWNFTKESMANNMRWPMEDCSFAVMLKNGLNVKVHGFTQNFFIKEEKGVEELWNDLKQTNRNLKKCIFGYHKASLEFKYQLKLELKSIELDSNHCRQFAIFSSYRIYVERFNVTGNHTYWRWEWWDENKRRWTYLIPGKGFWPTNITNVKEVPRFFLNHKHIKRRWT